MPFALQLQDSLRNRHCQVAGEFAAGDSLETVLGRHLLAVEASADTEMLTSILLLDESGRRILHGAAPSLPKSYCDAIDGIEIGPDVGSCGTAAFTGHAIYVTDVATDPLWEDYRHLALAHGLRACWSTPILDLAGKVIGTFAIYHLTPRGPTPGEVDAIRLITDHVAQAILWSRRAEFGRNCSGNAEAHCPAHLRLVSDTDSAAAEGDDTQFPEPGAASRFHGYASKLDRYAEMISSQKVATALKAVADDCRKLGEAVRDRQKESRDDR